jgi:hypothetical protein
MSDQDHASSPVKRPPTPGWVKAVLVALASLLSAFVLLHLTGHGFGDHMGRMHQ